MCLLLYTEFNKRLGVNKLFLVEKEIKDKKVRLLCRLGFVPQPNRIVFASSCDSSLVGYADVFYVHVLRCIKDFYTYDIASIIVINNNIFRLLTFNELLGSCLNPTYRTSC